MEYEYYGDNVIDKKTFNSLPRVIQLELIAFTKMGWEDIEQALRLVNDKLADEYISEMNGLDEED